MKRVIYILTILLLVLLDSCDAKRIKVKTSESSDNEVSTDSTMKTQNITLPVSEVFKPEVFLFKYSECKANCNDYERIISKKQKGDTLLLKIGSIQNCIGRFRIDLEENDEKLNLDIKVKEEIVKRKSGEVDTIMSILDCECYYYFNIGIKHIDKEYKTILVNGNNYKHTSKRNDQIIFVNPEIQPIFKNGGDVGLNAFIKENLKYPPTDENVSGRVYLSITVDTLGSVKDIEIKRGITKSADEEAIRVAKLLQFIPGSMNGKPIEMKMIIAINFSAVKNE